MAKVDRIQVTAYLSEDKHIEAWRKIKAHYGESVGDSTIMRNLIENFAARLDEGVVMLLSPEELSEKVISLERKFAEIERMLNRA